MLMSSHKFVQWCRWMWYWQVSRRRERILPFIARHIPRSLAYHAAVRVGADATTGAYGNQEVPAMYFMDALERWPKRQGGDRTNRKFRENQSLIQLASGQTYDDMLSEEFEDSDEHPAVFHARDLAEAIRLTVEYVGNDTLAAQEGWSWYDALKRYDPDMVKPFEDHPIHLHRPLERDPWENRFEGDHE